MVYLWIYLNTEFSVTQSLTKDVEGLVTLNVQM